MTPQFDNIVMSSYLMWLDNHILTNGSAFSNTNSQFYKIPSLYNGYHTYSAPYQQFVSDFSIQNANIPTGIYLNSSFLQKGQSGFHDINYEKGQIYFSGAITGTLTGAYAIKDFNLHLTSDPEETILFETKHSIRPKISQFTTGLYNNEATFPAIYIKNNGGFNENFAFGGLENTIINIRGIILSDSQFNLDAVCSIIRDGCKKYIPLISGYEMPFNSYGGYKSGNYNYTGLVANKNLGAQGAYIRDVTINRFNERVKADINSFNPTIYPAFFDVEIEKARMI